MKKNVALGDEDMYKQNKQLRIEDFVFPLGKLDQNNEWVQLAGMIPWGTIEELYAAQFVNNGHPAHPARMALGALLIKQRLKCSDEWVVRHISENPYLQFFIGLKEYGSTCPFGESTLVAFRKRFDTETLAKINEMIISEKESDNDDNDNNDDNHGGTLIMDATCVPSDVRYPQDLSLLNESREKLEKVMNDLQQQVGGNKPRNYRKRARKDYLHISKMRKKSAAAMRKAIRKQLGYVLRDINIVAQFVQNGARLTPKQEILLNTICTIYEQQYTMLHQHSHSVPDRIVSLAQPWVRPIVRNKAKVKTEFGAKLHLSLSEGYARVERLSFDAFNECNDFIGTIERYRSRTGRYPSRVLADKLYRNRANLNFCKEHGIQMTGPRLGRPPKNYKPDKKQEYADLCQRNTVEGAFGTVKTTFGLDHVYTRLEETTKTVISLAVLWLNLSKRLKALLRPLFQRLLRQCFAGNKSAFFGFA